MIVIEFASQVQLALSLFYYFAGPEISLENLEYGPFFSFCLVRVGWWLSASPVCLGYSKQLELNL